MARTAVYAGSFDPLTNGHLDVARRAAKVFDEVVLAVGENPKKRSLLSTDERMRILREVVGDEPRFRVDRFQGLLIDYCRSIGALAIVRGLRAVSDFEFEFQIGLANRDMAPEVETVFFLTHPSHIFISSSLIKEIAANGGDVTRYVPPEALGPLLAALK